MCVCVWLPCTHVAGRGPLGCLLVQCLPLSLRWGLLLFVAGYAKELTSCSKSPWDYRHVLPRLAFVCVPGIQMQVLSLVGQVLYPLSHLPSPIYSNFCCQLVYINVTCLRKSLQEGDTCFQSNFRFKSYLRRIFPMASIIIL